MNKFFLTRASLFYRNRGIGLLLMSVLTLASPSWSHADTALTLPLPLDLPSKPTAIPQEMRFITLGRVTFVTNHWQLTKTAKRMLDRMAAYLDANPGVERILVDGHTDWVGSAKFNDRLSDKRTQTVLDYLVSRGIDPTLIHMKGHGEHAPTDENWTRLGRIRNRQVELFAVYLSKPSPYRISANPRYVSPPG